MRSMLFTDTQLSTHMIVCVSESFMLIGKANQVQLSSLPNYKPKACMLYMWYEYCYAHTNIIKYTEYQN